MWEMGKWVAHPNFALGALFTPEYKHIEIGQITQLY